MSGRRDEHPGLGIDPDEIVIEEVPELDLDDDPTHSELPAAARGRPAPRRMLDRAPPPPGKPSLSQRASGRPMSAQEALAEARRAEQQRKASEDADLTAKREQARRLAQQAKQRAADAQRRDEQQAQRAVQEAREAEAQAARDRAAFGPRSDPAEERTKPLRADPMAAMVVEGQASELLDQLAFEHELIETYTEIPAAVVVPLWQAHVVRARHDGDLASLVAARSVVAAIGRGGSDVVACRVDFSGRHWAVWLDLQQGRVLACVEPAELYLVGLS